MRTRIRITVRLAAVCGAVLAALVPLPKAFIERFYSTFLYIHLQRSITPVANLVAFSLFDALVIAVAGAWLVALVEDVRRDRGRWRRVATSVAVRSIVWASILYLAFVFLWGFNYRREKLTAKLQIDSRIISPEGAFSLAATSVDRLNAIHDRAHAAGPAAFSSPAAGFDRAQRELGSDLVAIPGRPKHTLLSPFFRWTGVDGMTDPYFLETLIEDSVLPFERPFVVAHEWGHLAGFADESEASFAGWLTCVHGSAADQYSAWLFVFEELLPAVRGQDRAELVGRLAPGPLEDLRAIADRRRRQVSPRASRISSVVYDSYLKANRVPSGVANYGEVAGLLLGVQFGPDWTPKLNLPPPTGQIR